MIGVVILIYYTVKYMIVFIIPPFYTLSKFCKYLKPTYVNGILNLL